MGLSIFRPSIAAVSFTGSQDDLLTYDCTVKSTCPSVRRKAEKQ